MRIAIISDIHSNAYALEALEKSLKEQAIDKIYNLGDILGYNANPREALDWVKENVDLSLRGEHDTLIAGIEPVYITDPDAVKVADWTYERLNQEDFNYIENLPLDYENQNLILVHDDVSIPGNLFYITSEKDAKDALSAFNNKVCFYGHTHLPLIFQKDKDKKVKAIKESKISLQDGHTYLISVGSIGQPRDKDPRLCYAIYDMEKNTIEFIRAEYNTEKAAQDIKKQGLPERFAYRLLKGL